MKGDSNDFEYIGVDFMTLFLGLENEQGRGDIRQHLDNGVKEILGNYKKKKTLSFIEQP
jgi:hypothetical protein